MDEFLSKFILAYSVFLIFFSLIVSLGAGVFLGVTYEFYIPPAPAEPSIFGVIDFILTNWAIFFVLMGTTAEIGILGTFIFGPAVILLIYFMIRLLIELGKIIAEAIPF